MRSRRRWYAVAGAAAIVLTTAVPPATATAGPTAAPARPVGTGRLEPLGSLGGGESWAGLMNERGDIAGSSADAAGDWRAVLWRHGRRTPEVLPVGPASPTAISGNGHVAGRIHATGALFVWHRGIVRHVPPRPGADLEATGVDDHGRLVGTAYYADGTHRAFLVQRGRYTVLPAPRGSDSTAVGINDRGQIIGTVAARGTTAERAVLWQRGRMVRLGTLGGATSTPVAINDRGQVIGTSTVRSSAAEHPFRWQRGRMTDLLAGTAATGGHAYAINDTGTVTGTASFGDGRSRPVVWRHGRMTDIGLPGHTAIASAVSDRGHVAGLTWARPDDGPLPFRWHRGRTTVYPEPYADIHLRMIGVDRHGTLGVAHHSTHHALTVMRSA